MGKVWLKVYVGWSESEWLIVLSSEARLCWLLFLERVKTHGDRGQLAKASPSHLARIWYVGEESVRQMLKAAEIDGAIEDTGEKWSVVNWREYQGDPTGAERQARHRASRTKDADEGSGVTARNGRNALRNGVTTRVEEKRGEERRREEKRGEGSPRPSSDSSGPDLSQVVAYGASLGMDEPAAVKFYDNFAPVGWLDKNHRKITDWRARMKSWAAEDRLRGQQPAKSGDFLDDIPEATA